MTTRDLKISAKLDELVLDKGFSCKIGAVYKDKPVYKFSYGKTYTYYDLASLTKAIFTGLYFFNLNHNEKKVAEFFPCDASISIGDLLSHSSGLKGHKEHYRKLVKSSDKLRCLKKLLREDTGKLSDPVYSDLGYMILFFVIRELEGEEDLDLVFKRLKKTFNLPKGLHFNLENKAKFEKSLYAPTEFCEFRNKKIQGEVLDRNTWAMGGLSTHAGLFGTFEDMLGFYKTLKAIYKASKFKTLTEGWTYGFMKPSGESTAGKYFSEDSIGHLGFTGVSFWYDPRVDFYVTVLSNRTYPDRDKSSFNSFRPWIHDFLYKEFVNGKI